MKNKGLIIGLVAIIVILIGVVVFLLVRDNNEENVEATPTDAEKFAEEYQACLMIMSLLMLPLMKSLMF